MTGTFVETVKTLLVPLSSPIREVLCIWAPPWGIRAVYAVLARSAWTDMGGDTIQQQPDPATKPQHNRPSREWDEARRSSVAQLLPAERQRTTKDESRSKQVPRSKRRTDPFPHISPCSNSRPEHYIYATWDDVIKYIPLNLDKHSKKTHFKNVKCLFERSPFNGCQVEN